MGAKRRKKNNILGAFPLGKRGKVWEGGGKKSSIFITRIYLINSKEKVPYSNKPGKQSVLFLRLGILVPLGEKRTFRSTGKRKKNSEKAAW